MKKTYKTPEAYKIDFNYREQVVASSESLKVGDFYGNESWDTRGCKMYGAESLDVTFCNLFSLG